LLERRGRWRLSRHPRHVALHDRVVAPRDLGKDAEEVVVAVPEVMKGCTRVFQIAEMGCVDSFQDLEFQVLLGVVDLVQSCRLFPELRLVLVVQHHDEMCTRVLSRPSSRTRLYSRVSLGWTVSLFLAT